MTLSGKYAPALERRFPVRAFKNALLQIALQLRPQGDGFVEHRIAAFGIRADANQIAVTLKTRQQLFEGAHSRVMLLTDQRRHCATDRRFNIDSRIVPGFRQSARQHNVTVEDCPRGVSNGVLLVIAFGEHGIKRGNRAAAANAISGTLDQCR